MLREDKLTLQKAITICRADEESKKHLINIKTDQDPSNVDTVKKRQSKNKKKFEVQGARPKTSTTTNYKAVNKCSKCGSEHEKGKCPAYGKKCFRCTKMNHYSRCCKLTGTPKAKRDVFEMNFTDGEFDEDVYIDTIKMSKTEVQEDQCFTTLNINSKQVKFKIDTGSQVNIIPRNVYNIVINKKAQFQPTKTRLASYTGDRLAVLEKVKLKCMGQVMVFL